jgi:hypothetical protein
VSSFDATESSPKKRPASATGVFDGMQRLRRVLATLFLLAFLPVTMLAASPLRYCKSADHHALELLVGGTHASEHASHHNYTATASGGDECGHTIEAAHEVRCSDSSILDVARSGQPIELPPNAAVDVAKAILIAPATGMPARAFSHFTSLIDPRVRERQIAVLRI